MKEDFFVLNSQNVQWCTKKYRNMKQKDFALNSNPSKERKYDFSQNGNTNTGQDS